MLKDTNPKIALISMRSDFIASRKERRDSIDESIYKMIHDLGFTPLLIANDLIAVSNLLSKIDIHHIGLVVFSGGNDLTCLENNQNSWEIRDEVEEMLLNICIKNNLPILGICRGLQFIATKLGIKLEIIKGHINTIHKNKIINTDKYLDFNSFHSWGLKYTNNQKLINPIAICAFDQTIEAFYTNTNFHAICLMWHPERANGQYKFSIKIIKSFLSSYEKKEIINT
tara:strand:- start:7560 stop:8240 length:681 start_codon:yes stop_codon:yes gene_type:complete